MFGIMEEWNGGTLRSPENEGSYHPILTHLQPADSSGSQHSPASANSCYPVPIFFKSIIPYKFLFLKQIFTLSCSERKANTVNISGGSG